LVRSAFGPSQRGPSFFRSQASHCDSRNYEFVKSSRRWREKTRVEISEHTLGFIEVSD
jgi:hypothetical protein